MHKQYLLSSLDRQELLVVASLPVSYTHLMCIRDRFRDILPFHWGEDVIFHHKTGSLDCVEHDAGIIETMNGDFCFVLLMSHLDNDKAKQLGAQMGLIMKEFVEDALP